MRALGKAANKRPNQKNAGIRRVDQIKTHPVVARHLFMQALGDTLHHGLSGGSGFREVLKFPEKFLCSGIMVRLGLANDTNLRASSCSDRKKYAEQKSRVSSWRRDSADQGAVNAKS
jgi:hypothetical protein